MISPNVCDLDALEPTVSVTILAGTSGYFFTAVIRMVLLSRDADLVRPEFQALGWRKDRHKIDV